ncbi:MAG: hypothetical protein IPJ19_18850 [Planctomycetes bacterium]|nr:hypothetical protein [Planctomycetota bacterium]
MRPPIVELAGVVKDYGTAEAPLRVLQASSSRSIQVSSSASSVASFGQDDADEHRGFRPAQRGTLR